MIDHMLDRFVRAGMRTAVVNVHHLADQIEAHLSGRKDIEILFSDERDELLDQGGGIAKALPLLRADPFFICNTDAFWIEGPRQNLQAPRRGLGSGQNGHPAARRRDDGEHRRRLAGRFHDGR